MIQNLWNTIYNAVMSVITTFAAWILALWQVAWDVLMDVFRIFENWITFFILWIVGLMSNIGYMVAHAISSVTGFNVNQMSTAWGYVWQGYQVAEFFVPITACITILLAGFYAAATVRLARWMISCIPWGTANG